MCRPAQGDDEPDDGGEGKDEHAKELKHKVTPVVVRSIKH